MTEPCISMSSQQQNDLKPTAPKTLAILQCMASAPSCGKPGSRVAYGGERSTLLLCKGLVNRGHRITFACPAGSSFTDLFKETGMPVVPLEMTNASPWKSWRTIVKLALYLRRERPDLVVVQMSKGISQVALACRLARIPLLATSRSLKKLTAYRPADHVIAVAGAIKKQLLEAGLEEKRVDVVYNGVDIGHFKPNPENSAIKSRLGLPASGIIIGVMSRLDPEKGHDWFLRAARKVADHAPHVHFVFVGNGSRREALEEQAASSGLADRLTFAGYHEDITPWITAMDIVVLPSVDLEGLSRVLLESGAMGKPSIGTPVGGTAEIISHGETGFIVPVRDEAALSAAMIELVDDDGMRRRMGAAARKRIEELFSLEAMIENTETVYQRVAGSR